MELLVERKPWRGCCCSTRLRFIPTVHGHVTRAFVAPAFSRMEHLHLLLDFYVHPKSAARRVFLPRSVLNPRHRIQAAYASKGYINLIPTSDIRIPQYPPQRNDRDKKHRLAASFRCIFRTRGSVFQINFAQCSACMDCILHALGVRSKESEE